MQVTYYLYFVNRAGVTTISFASNTWLFEKIWQTIMTFLNGWKFIVWLKMGVGLLFEVNIVGHSQAVETLNCSCIYVQSCGYARSVCQEVIKPVIFFTSEFACVCNWSNSSTHWLAPLNSANVVSPLSIFEW